MEGLILSILHERVNLKEFAMESTYDANISSAEMTAYWRSLYPRLSGDMLSASLATEAGIAKAKEFEQKFNYSLVGRKVSVRSGFLLETATQLLSSGKYDSCISLASGFSLLTHHIALLLKFNYSDLAFLDLDLPHIAKERSNRLQALLKDSLFNSINSNINILALDLENACKEGQTFQEIFKLCKKPLFIIEGVIYFLSENCVKWIIDNVLNYETVGLLLDYWPEAGIHSSDCFKRVVGSLKGFIPEDIKSFWSENSIQALGKQFLKFQDVSISDIEHNMSRKIGETPQFIDQHSFFPVRIVIAEKK